MPSSFKMMTESRSAATRKIGDARDPTSRMLNNGTASGSFSLPIYSLFGPMSLSDCTAVPDVGILGSNAAPIVLADDAFSLNAACCRFFAMNVMLPGGAVTSDVYCANTRLAAFRLNAFTMKLAVK